MAAALATTAGVHNDKVRDLFGMSKGGATASTSGLTQLKKMATATEEYGMKSVANDNLILREMQAQTKLLKEIRAGVKSSFGLTDLLMGKLLGGVVGKLGSGLAAVGRGTGLFLRGVGTGILASFRNSIMGLVKPITNGFKTLLSPITKLTSGISSIFRVPSISGALSGIIKAAPKMLGVFGRLASKIFLPLTAIMAAVDGISGAWNAEKLLGRNGVNAFDRVLTGISSAINGLLFGIPDWISRKLNFSNFASMVDAGSQKVQQFFADIPARMGRFVEQIASYIPNPVELAGRYANFVVDTYSALGGFIKDRFVGTVDALKGYFPEASRIAGEIGGAVWDKVTEIGTTIKNELTSVFDGVTQWVKDSFQGLKDEIKSWMPWNWTTGSNGAPTVNPAEPGKKPDDAERPLMLRVRPRAQASLEAAPILQAAIAAPVEVAKVAERVAAIEAGPYSNVAGMAATAVQVFQPIQQAAQVQAVTTAKAIEQTTEVQAEIFEEKMGEIVEKTGEEMEDISKSAKKGFELMKDVFGTLGGAAKPVADAMAQAMQDAAGYYSSGGVDPSVLPSFGGSAGGTVTAPQPGGSTATPGAALGTQPPANAFTPGTANTNPSSFQPAAFSNGAVTSVPSTTTATAVRPQSAAEFAKANGVDVSKLPAGMRNNNPGNLKYNANVPWAGLVGPSTNTDEGDFQAVFNSPEMGMRAMAKLLQNKSRQGFDTAAKMIAAPNGWTPGKMHAAVNVAKSMGVGLHEKLDFSNPDTLQKFMRALITQEHGPSGNMYSDDMIRKGIALSKGKDIDFANAQKAGEQYKLAQAKASGDVAKLDSGLFSNQQMGGTPAMSGELPQSVLNMRVKDSDGKTRTVGQMGIKTYADFNKKGGQAFMGGYNDPNTTFLTSKIQEHLGDKFDRVTAQNDMFHKIHKPNSEHTQGYKSDFTVKGITERQGHQMTSEFLRSKGMVEGRDFKMISQLHGTGPHIDFKLTESGKKIVSGWRQQEEVQAKITQIKTGKGGSVSGLASSIFSNAPAGSAGFAAGDNDNKPSTAAQTSKSDLSLTDRRELAAAERQAKAVSYDKIKQNMTGFGEFSDAQRSVVDSKGVLLQYPVGSMQDSVSRTVASGRNYTVPRVEGATTAAGPKQPKPIPLDTPTPAVSTPVPPPRPAPPVKAADNSGSGGAGNDKPSLNEVPSIDELSLLMVNSDAMA